MSYWNCPKCGSHNTVTTGEPDWAVFRSWDITAPVRCVACVACGHDFEMELTATGRHDVEFVVEGHE